MTETLGAARLLLSVDTTDFEAAIARSKNAAAGLGAEAEAAFSGSDARAKRAATSLLNYANAIGKGVDEQRLLNAAVKGVPTQVLDAAKTRMEDYRNSIEATKRQAQALADTAAFERQAAEAAKLVKASEYVRFWEEAMESAEIQQKKMAADNGFVANLQRQAAAIGKTRAELLELEAAERGVSAQAAPYIAQLKAQEQQLLRSGIAFNKYGLSAKQTQAALRQVPAQLTDIFVSLQGGQAPLTVLLQQGGQLKDVFGGITPAAKALGSAVLGLVTPFTVAAAAAAALVYGFLAGSQEAVEFNKAIITTGNRAGVTADELAGLRTELDALGGVTGRQAASALTELVRAGAVTERNFRLVSEAAVLMQAASGKAISETVKEFSDLAKDPVAAIMKLDEAQNFLTRSVLEQIISLRNQGREIEAVSLATETYANVLKDRSEEMVENLGYVEFAWKRIKQGALETVDALLGIGRTLSNAERLLEITREQEEITREWVELGGGLANMSSADRDRLLQLGEEKKQLLIQQGKEAEQQAAANARREAEAAGKTLLFESQKYLSKQEQLNIERLRIGELASKAFADAIVRGDLAGAAAIRANADTIFAGLEKKYQEDQRSVRGEVMAGLRATLDAIKNAGDQERSAIQNSTTLLQSEFSARLISVEDYYTRLKALTESEAAVQEKSLQSQARVLAQANFTGKDAIDVARQLADVEAALAKVRADGATKLAVLTVQEQQALAQRNYAIQQYGDALARSNALLADQIAFAVAAVGMGSKEADQQRQIAAAYLEREEALRVLQDRLATRQIDRTTYDAEVELQRAATEARVRIIQDGFAAMAAAELDWRNGARQGLMQWLEDAQDVAGQVSRAFQQGLDRTTDALKEFAMTGKLEWKAYLADILKMLLDFFAKRAVAQFAEFIAGAFLNGGATSSGYTPSGGAAGSPGPVGFAKGAVFANSPSLSAYSNQVHDKPQVFKFARGAGVFAEAGPEAIMPLKRGPDGTLGVKMHGGGTAAAAGVNLTVNTIINSDNSSATSVTSEGGDTAAYKMFTERVATITKQELDKQMRPGGMLWRSGVGAKQ